jgi:hypothetical protein
MFWFKKKPKTLMMDVFIDWDNIKINMPADSPLNFSMAAGFERMIRQLAKVAPISQVFIFGPPDAINIDLDLLDEQGFCPRPCPKARNKRTGEEIDTVDPKLMDFAGKMIDRTPELTHICLASGDKHFAPLIRHAKRHGLEVLIVAGSKDSLSRELFDLADKDPEGEKMVYYFSPSENDSQE